MAKNLLLFDYDGVVASNPGSFDIMKQALEMAAGLFGIDDPEIDFKNLFSATSGTTEAKLAMEACGQLGIGNINAFLEKFIFLRSAMIWGHQLGLRDTNTDGARNGEYIYPDFMDLIRKLDANSLGPDTLIGLVTGNPSMVMKTRLPPELNKIFNFQVTGEQALTRKELIRLALEKAKGMGWAPTVDPHGRHTNAFYFDDTTRATLQGLDANVRCVHIPRCICTPEESEFAKLYGEVFHKYGFEVGGRLISGDLLSSPSLFVPNHKEGLGSEFLLIDRHTNASTTITEGFLDPKAHQEWSRFGEGMLQDEMRKSGLGMRMGSRR